MERIAASDADLQQYIFFDMGHNSIKVANYSKNLNKPFDYFKIPTQLFPWMVEDLHASALNKQNIEL